MVIKTKEELDQRLLDGWGLSKKKNRYWYLQKRDPETGKILTEKVDDSLKDYCEEQYMLNKLKRKGVDVNVEPSTSKVEQQIEKAVERKVVQHAIKHIDKRTKKLLEWGEWVDMHITTIVPGSTWEEKAEQVINMLNDMFKVYLDFESIENELQKLRVENRLLKDLTNELKKRLDPINQLKELIISMKDGNPEIVKSLVDKWMTLLLKMRVEQTREV